MVRNCPILFQFIAVLLAAVCSSALCRAADGARKVHVVYMGSLRNMEMAQSSHHFNLLQSVVGSSAETESAYVRSYGRSFNGFAAKLTDSEREKLASMDGVVSVFPSRRLQTQTTRSWDFVGFHEKVNRDFSVERDVIIGSIDTGIWPESESFNDEGLPRPPRRWKGVCAGGKNFTCNKKIIGARYYTSSSARDNVGHGSHTASTAAGNAVRYASFNGLAAGVARGAVPSARIAAYKVCDHGCLESDILAAFDDAIADGVDIITISIGIRLGSLMFRSDVIAIGSFHAMVRGILTVQSAGNNGPAAYTVGSLAPWLFSVGATTTDRKIVSKVVLGNGRTVVGYAVNSFHPKRKKLPLIFGTDASRNCSRDLSQRCADGCLDHELVKGKIVQCLSLNGTSEALRAGAGGSIALNFDWFVNVSVVVPFSATALNLDDYDDVAKYATSVKKPHAKILRSEAIKDPSSPQAALFSSRGPNYLMPEIMKPDISAPGVDILAAFSQAASPSDKRSVKFSILSGTSMSCPHVAGVAAYVKSFHQNWSPSAIKSAIMTTAKQIVNTDRFQIGEFIYGSGLINPKQAIKPGLIFETSEQDYINLLCGNGYDTNSVRRISGDNSITCSSTNATTFFPPKDLNYPSMVAQVLPMQPFVVKFQRTVTNVGVANSTYKPTFLPFSEVYAFKSPEKLETSVAPEELSFKALNEKKSFTVTVAGGRIPSGTAFSTSLVWSDSIHRVRSPVVVNVVEKSSSLSN